MAITIIFCTISHNIIAKENYDVTSLRLTLGISIVGILIMAIQSLYNFKKEGEKLWAYIGAGLLVGALVHIITLLLV